MQFQKISILSPQKGFEFPGGEVWIFSGITHSGYISFYITVLTTYESEILW